MMQTFHGYVRLLIGVLLTAVIGAWIAEQFRAHSAQYDSAERVFHDHSALLGQRLHHMRELTRALEAPEGVAGAEAELAAYRAFLGTYNAERNFNRVMIELYFGQTLWNEERDLHYALRWIGQEIECLIKSPGAIDPEAIDKDIDKGWESLSALSKGLGTALRDNRIGRLRDRTAVAATPLPPAPACPAAPSP